MAFLPIAHVAVNYRDYGGSWIKAYRVNTTTPKVMALKSDGTNQVAKLELNVDGFIVTSGDALVIPYIDGIYDLYMFPTEAEADANDTINALRIADGSQGEDGANISEIVTLVDGQTTVTLSTVNSATGVFYVQGRDVDQGLMSEGTDYDYTITDGSTLELNSSYPEGSFITAYGSVDVPAFSTLASLVVNVPSGNTAATDQQSFNDELALLNIVIPQTVNGLLTANGRVNQIRDSGAFTMPLANSVLANTVLVVELPDTYTTSTPILTRTGADLFEDNAGTDTSITWSSAAKLTLTSDGINTWRL